MKRVLISLLLFPLAVLPALATDWSVQAAKLRDSVVYIESAGGSCSGAVIDSTRDYVLTAAHCDGEKLFIDQSPAKVISKDVKSDLMVAHVDGLERPALKLALKNPVTGQEVATYGYGFGLEQPLFRTHHVSDAEAQLPELPYRYVAVDSAFLPGQSGGPVVDLNNQVVAVVQRSNGTIGIGVGAETIKSKVGKYFGR
jgi:S1-C subfamily serine protease